ncbi:hypothetical protein SDC9_152247 [bioreactor metagenome]|uniref:Uncharacterized protein n=1 Tax=bioreactor metagenome TaxID=1076179 RepID=A0A645ESK2_9ZZZZ
MDGLWQYDMDKSFYPAESHGNTGFCLTSVDTFDGSSEHFGNISGKIHGKGDDGNGDSADIERG